MTVVCPGCSTQLRLQGEKVPAGPYTLRCPKCKKSFSPEAGSLSNDSAMQKGNDGGIAEVPPKPQDSTPSEEMALSVSPVLDAGAIDSSALSQLLLGLLQGADRQPGASPQIREPNQVLVCVEAEYRDKVARALGKKRLQVGKAASNLSNGAYGLSARHGYNVYVAENTTHAIERMRDEHMDIVILDQEFDAVEQGAAFIKREVNSLRPSERRRLFFVIMSPAFRTSDSHAAFISHVNLVVNPSDIEELPDALERAMKSFGELYREFNRAVASTSAFA